MLEFVWHKETVVTDRRSTLAVTLNKRVTLGESDVWHTDSESCHNIAAKWRLEFNPDSIIFKLVAFSYFNISKP